MDLLGLVLRVLVTAANVPERQAAKKLLQRVERIGGDKVKRLQTIGMDGGYRGEDFRRARDGYVAVGCRDCPETFGKKRFCPLTKALGG